MIALDQVSVFRPGSRQRQPIVLDATINFGSRERIGILAPAGSGKSTLTRVLAGVDQPDIGDVMHRGRVSWPLGFAGFLHPELSAAQNLTIIARLTGQDSTRLVAFCTQFCEFAGGLDRRTGDLSPTERAILAYSCNMAVPAIHLIADETITVGDGVMQMKCEAMLEQRLRTGGLILVSKNSRQIGRYCNRYFVLIHARLTPCSDLDVAQMALSLSTPSSNISGPAHV